MPEAIEFKDGFVERYSQLTDFEQFKEYSLKYPRRSIRVNTLKMNVADVKKRLQKKWRMKPVPWCNEGFFVEHPEGRRDIGNTVEHVLGYIYVQEASSMIPPIVLDVKPGEIVLDMCASPGSKSTQMAAMMQNKGMLVCNDYKGARLAPLGINLQRIGSTNTMISLMEGRFFKNMTFDKILVDAPCSGTGTIRKSLKTLRIWNPNMIRRLGGTQKQLLNTAFGVVKDGGTVVYSTCSLEPEEDEAVIDDFLSKHNDAQLEKIDVNVKSSQPVMKFEGETYSEEVSKCLRIWPQDNDTEGFFIAKIRKG